MASSDQKPRSVVGQQHLLRFKPGRQSRHLGCHLFPVCMSGLQVFRLRPHCRAQCIPFGVSVLFMHVQTRRLLQASVGDGETVCKHVSMLA